MALITVERIASLIGLSMEPLLTCTMMGMQTASGNA
jgi:hypothetical protein